MVYPFGDRRQYHYETRYIFDLLNDTVSFDRRDRFGRLPLSTIRERTVKLDDFEPCEPPRPPQLDIQKDFPQACWEPVLEVWKQNASLVRRLLNDFDFQWRHILRQTYNDVTFRKLASAIIHMASLDLKVKECSKLKYSSSGALVGLLALPEWRPLEQKIVEVSKGWLVACQTPSEAISLIEEHSSSLESCTEIYDSKYYLVLTVRHIILCRPSRKQLEWTKAEPLLNGTETLSNRALGLLLWILSPTPPKNRLQTLPLELQDRILRYESKGPIESVRLGCLIGIGSPFNWKDGRMDVIRIRIDLIRRDENAPVESQIWFGDVMSGISYMGSVASLKSRNLRPTC